MGNKRRGYWRERREHAPWRRASPIGLRLLAAGVLAVPLTACAPPAPPAPRVDIYKDHFEYLGDSYRSPSALAIGIEAANRQPSVVDVHDCEALNQLKPVLKVIRAHGPLKAAVVLPKNC